MSYHELRFSELGLHELTRQLQSSRELQLSRAVGCLSHGDQRRWLVHTLERAAPPTNPRLLVVGSENPNQIEAITRRGIAASEWHDETLVLTLGVGRARGRLAAAWCFQGRVEPVQQFVLVGPGWLRLPRSEFEFSTSTPAAPALHE